MKSLLSLLFLLGGLTLSGNPHFISSDKILLTSEGLFLKMEGTVVEVKSVSFESNGVYKAECYGHCGRCGWPLDHEGKCNNRNCDGYGPPDHHGA